MNGGNYWEQFEKSGRIEDYLTYAVSSRQGKAAGEISSLRPPEGFGEYPYAGFYYGDRNGDKPDARGGI